MRRKVVCSAVAAAAAAAATADDVHGLHESSSSADLPVRAEKS